MHDWDSGQKNYGTLLTNHDIYINAALYDGTSDNTGGLASTGIPIVYASNDPDSNSVSSEYNKNADLGDWRIWLPNVTANIFTGLSAANNSDYTVFASGSRVTPTNLNSVGFNLPVTTDSQYSSWASGDQISFLFGITDSSNNTLMIKHTPIYDSETSYNTPTGIDYPLYAVRMTDTSNPNSLDLWSLKLKDVTLQRGGATILNNVINVNAGEKTVVQVDMKKNGNLNVMVMTLDGNIVTYLQHGKATKGTHYYRWDGRNNAGDKVARGLYFIRISGPDIDETRKVMVVKN